MVYVSGYLRIRHRRVERVRPHMRRHLIDILIEREGDLG
jgi:hypothetical protein